MLAIVFLTAAAALGKVIKYGDHITLTQKSTGNMLHSLTKMQWAKGGQIVTSIPEEVRGDDYSSVSWIVKAACNSTNVPIAERVQYFSSQSTVPKTGLDVFSAKSAGAPVKCNSLIRLEHSESNLVLTVQEQQKTQITGGQELVALPRTDSHDLFRVECSDEYWTAESDARFSYIKNQYIGSFPTAVYNSYNCQRCPMKRQVEVSLARHSPIRSTWIAKHILNVNNSADEIYDEAEYSSSSNDDDDDDERDEL